MRPARGKSRQNTPGGYSEDTQIRTPDNHRIDLRHRQAADEGHQGSRVEGGRAGHGVQADRVRPAPLARGERPAPGRARPGRSDLHRRQARRATWRGCLTSRIARRRRAAAMASLSPGLAACSVGPEGGPVGHHRAPIRCRAGVAMAEPATTARLNGTSVTAAAAGCRAGCLASTRRPGSWRNWWPPCSGMRRWFRGAAAGTATRPEAARRGGPAVGDEGRGRQRRCQPGDGQGLALRLSAWLFPGCCWFAGCGSSCGLRSSTWPRPFRKTPKKM